MIAGLELSLARLNAPFDNSQLKPLMVALLSGAKEEVRRDFLLNLVLNDPLFIRWKREKPFLGRVEDEFAYLIYLVDDLIPIQMHELGFIPYIHSNGTQEQIDYWVPKAERYEVIGCYAQTELGHGSNISALETTATYITSEDCWEINSPSLTSTKWWVGSLGIIATHCVLMARMLVNDEDCGIQAFLVPLRDLKSHAAYSGVFVGEIGPKMGVNSMDNGFLRFNKYRIPRNNLLMKFTQVSKGGIVTRTGNEKMKYFGMTSLRSNFVGFSALTLAKGVTIGIRYATVRKQFKRSDSDEETSIISYPTVHTRLLPLLASTFAFCFAGFYLSNELENIASSAAENDSRFSNRLNAFHALTSALKSFCTTTTSQGLEDIRLCCGGHGYSIFSGLPETYCSFVHMNTAEGENWLITQQAVRWIFKVYNGLKEGKLSNNDVDSLFDYIVEAALENRQSPQKYIVEPSSFLSSKLIIDLFKLRAALLLLALEGKIISLMLRGKGFLDAWTCCQVEIFQLSQAHSELTLLKMFLSSLEGPLRSHQGSGKSPQPASLLLKRPLNDSFPSLYDPLKKMFYLLGLTWIEKNAADFLKHEILSATQLEILNVLLYGYCSDTTIQPLEDFPEGFVTSLIPYAVPLADGLAIPDYVINSALGSGDGRVYARLWDWVLFGGYFSSPGSSNINLEFSPKMINKFNLNRTYNRELYQQDSLDNLPLFDAFKRNTGIRQVGLAEDGDDDREEDRVDTAQTREWQEIHALVIRPLVSGEVAKQYEKSSISKL